MSRHPVRPSALTVQRIGVAGNVAALVLIALLLSGEQRLFGTEATPVRAAVPDAPAAPASGGERWPVLVTGDTSPVLLVVIDGLRADVADDPATMPELARLAERGGRGTLGVEAMVPATLGAIVAMIEGREVAPVAVLRDFGARPAAEGGVLERLAERGGRSFVAGTALWHQLYGRWIDAGVALAGFPDAAADGRAERAGQAALANAYDLVVVHLGEVDRIGHRHGARSEAYTAAVRRADAAIGRLAAAAGPTVRVVVTADHGITVEGGHAGPERAARVVPLVVAGPGMASGALGHRPQRELSASLGTALGASAPGRVAAASDGTLTAWPARVAAALGLALVAGVLMGSTAVLRSVPRAAVVLATGPWLALGAAALGGARAGASLAAGMLLLVAALLALSTAGSGRARVRREASRDRSAVAAPVRAFAIALGVGAAFAALRVADALGAAFAPVSVVGAGAVATLVLAALASLFALVPGRAPFGPVAAHAPTTATTMLSPRPTLLACALAGLGAWLGGPSLAATVLVAFAVGLALPRARRALPLGIALAVLPGALARLSGETISLSSIDVALAHRLVDGAAGLGGAIAATVLRTALPALTLAAGWVVGGRGRVNIGLAGAMPVPRATVPPCTIAACAFVATHAGAALVFFACLVGAPSRADAVAALGLGGLLRTLVELCWLALGLGLGLAVRQRVRRLRHRPVTSTS